MSYEDLKEVRNTRAAKDNAKATAGKGKRGRKRKCSELGLDSERRTGGRGGLVGTSAEGKSHAEERRDKTSEGG